MNISKCKIFILFLHIKSSESQHQSKYSKFIQIHTKSNKYKMEQAVNQCILLMPSSLDVVTMSFNVGESQVLSAIRSIILPSYAARKRFSC